MGSVPSIGRYLRGRQLHGHQRRLDLGGRHHHVDHHVDGADDLGAVVRGIRHLPAVASLDDDPIDALLGAAGLAERGHG